ncbi:protein of unknown function [Streptomyces sp. KY75]|nr:protein of unknown function [Streptomyces sp. KY75]
MARAAGDPWGHPAALSGSSPTGAPVGGVCRTRGSTWGEATGRSAAALAAVRGSLRLTRGGGGCGQRVVHGVQLLVVLVRGGQARGELRFQEEAVVLGRRGVLGARFRAGGVPGQGGGRHGCLSLGRAALYRLVPYPVGVRSMFAWGGEERRTRRVPQLRARAGTSRSGTADDRGWRANHRTRSRGGSGIMPWPGPGRGSEHHAEVRRQAPVLAQDVEREARRLVAVGRPVPLPGHAQGPRHGGPDDERVAGEGGGGGGVGVAGEDGDDPRVGVQEGGEALRLLQPPGVGQRVVELDGRLVEGDQRGDAVRERAEGGVDPGEGLRVEAALVAAGDGGVAHQDRGSGDVVDPVDGRGGRGLAEERLAVGGAGVVVAGAGQDGEGGGQDAGRLLVLRLRRVVGDVSGDQQGVDRAGQGPQVLHDAGRPARRAFTAVQVQIADLSEQHVGTPPVPNAIDSLCR